MSNELINEPNPVFDIEIGRNWPEQIIVDHAPYWRAWRRQSRPVKESVQKVYAHIGRTWMAFANGKNLGPRLMMDWMSMVVSIESETSESGVISNQRAARYRTAVASYLGWLRLMGAISMDPSDCMPSPGRTPPRPKQVYTHEEYLRMVKYGERNVTLSTELWLLVLGYHSGMSLVDCCTLDWSQVHLPNDGPCYIQRMRTKLALRYGTKAICTVPLLVGGELWVYMKRLNGQRDRELDRSDGAEYVCQDAADMARRGSELASHAMAAFIAKALGEDRKERSFRHLRNSFASRLINAGTDCILVSKMTGHMTVQQLADYVVPNQESMQRAMLNGLRFAEGETKLPASTKDNEPENLCQMPKQV